MACWPASFSPGDGGYPDLVSIDDNARLQKKLVDDVFDGRQLSLAYGYSMGGMQALAFARLFPEAAARVMCVCGAAGCEAYNAVFLEALLAVLEGGGTREEKLRAFGTVYAGWGVGYQFYRDKSPARRRLESLEVRRAVVRRRFCAGRPRRPAGHGAHLARRPPAPPGLENIKARVLLRRATRRVPRRGSRRARATNQGPSCAPWRRRPPRRDPQRPGMGASRLQGAVSRPRGRLAAPVLFI